MPVFATACATWSLNTLMAIGLLCRIPYEVRTIDPCDTGVPCMVNASLICLLWHT
jgi:hypothetical protein